MGLRSGEDTAAASTVCVPCVRSNGKSRGLADPKSGHEPGSAAVAIAL